SRPAEVEEALIEHPAVSEAAVIGVPDEITGESIVAFIVIRQGYLAAPSLIEEVSARVASTLGSTLKPRAIHMVTELPKTQSGKIVRRAIRQAYLGHPIGDLSTVENPGALESFR